MPRKRPAGVRYACFRVHPRTGEVQRDFAGCKTLEEAVDLLLPGHVERGWKVREEYPRVRKCPLVTHIFDVELVDGHVVVVDVRAVKPSRSARAASAAAYASASVAVASVA